MAEYIEREAVIAEIVAEAEKQGKKSYDMAEKGCDDLSVKYTHGEYCYSVAEHIVKTATAADVVEVVRCKDCLYNANGTCIHSEFYNDTTHRPDYFCADGIRKEVQE